MILLLVKIQISTRTQDPKDVLSRDVSISSSMHSQWKHSKCQSKVTHKVIKRGFTYHCVTLIKCLKFERESLTHWIVLFTTLELRAVDRFWIRKLCCVLPSHLIIRSPKNSTRSCLVLHVCVCFVVVALHIFDHTHFLRKNGTVTIIELFVVC